MHVLQLNSLTDTLAVSGQPAAADIAQLATRGFQVVVCNRPDGEEPGQPTMAEMEAATVAAGMTFMRYPVNPGNFPGDDLAGLAKIFQSGQKVFAYCRTGTRCANLWVATRAPELRAQAADIARGLGFDLSLVSRLV